VRRSTFAASALVLTLVATQAATAHAEDVVMTQPAPVTSERTTSEAGGPSWAMVGTGVAIFGAAYVPAVVVGSTSGLSEDRSLLVPVAGPWIDLANRPGCGPAGSCNTENTDKVLLVVDGAVQGIGVLTFLGGFLVQTHETKTVRSAAKANRPTLQLSPARMAGDSYGLLAHGTF
jgi:hypothetical protein